MDVPMLQKEQEKGSIIIIPAPPRKLPPSPDKAPGPFPEKESIHMATMVRMENFLSAWGKKDQKDILCVWSKPMAEALRQTIGNLDANTSNVTNLKVEMISKMPSQQPKDGPKVYPHDYMPENVADVIVYLRNFYTAALAGRKNLLVLRTSLTMKGTDDKFIWSHAMLLLAGINKKTNEFWIQVFDPNGIYQAYKTNPKTRYEGIEWIPWVFLELSYYTVEIKFTAEVKKFAETARDLHGKKDTIKPWTVYFMRVFMENMAVYPNREDVNQIHHVVELWQADLIEVIDQDRFAGRPNLLDEAGFDTMADLIKVIKEGHRGEGVCEHIVDLVALMVISMPVKYRNGWKTMAYGDYNAPCAPSYGDTNDPSASASEESEKKESRLICKEVMISEAEEKEYGWLNGLFLSTEYSDQIGPKAWRAMVALETWGYLDGFTGVVTGTGSRFDGLSWQIREYQRRTNKRQKRPLGVSKVLELFQPGGALDPSHPSADMARYFMGVHADQNMDAKSIPDSDYVIKVWWMLTNAINMFRIWMEIGQDSGKLIKQLGLPSDVAGIQLAIKKPVDVMLKALNFGKTKREYVIIVKALERNLKQMHSTLVASVQGNGKLSDRGRRLILRLFKEMSRLFPSMTPFYLIKYSNDIFKMQMMMHANKLKDFKLKVESTLESINKRVFHWHYVFRSMVKDVVNFLKHKAAITYTQSGLYQDEIGKMATVVDLLFRDPIQEWARQRGSLVRQHGTVEMWYLLNECMRRARRLIELEEKGHLKRIKDFPAIELIVLDRNFPIFLTPPRSITEKGLLKNPLMSAMVLTWVDISDKIIHEWGGRPVHVLDCLARWVVSVRAMPKNVFAGGLETEMILAGNLRKDLRLSKDTRVKLLSLHIHWKESTKTVVNHYEAWGKHRNNETSTYAVVIQGLSQGYYVTKAVTDAIKISGLPGSLPQAKTFKNMLKAPLWNLLKGYFVPSLHMMIQLRGLASMKPTASQRIREPVKKRQRKKKGV